LNLTLSHTSTELKLTLQEWISALKLSTMWEFPDIRNGAIHELSKAEMEMGSVDKIECGRKFEKKEWLLDGYVGLLKRTETITDEEAERLGWKTAAKLLRIREQQHSIPQSPAPGEICSVCHGLGDDGSDLCKICDGYGKGVAGITPASGHPRQRFIEAVQKEFQTEL